ncbi:EF-hand calcium-binding domain-containing protein 4A isoform X6 [Nerophis ophidion]|uniref:EF-hand calcium-binding domain-containing protein 4A isoform X6 n=1 Tax=Nerophis ophidion TaxID=159077 RepID=UPI002ADFB894|nr:EF-hand calcium-binding domain-containing protein 4A isoform X6 [Nerophis ophidion]
MSKWLNDGEVLEGKGSGEAVPVSPRPRVLPAGSPMLGRGHSPLGSPIARRASAASSPQAETLGKAKELFVLCDKEGKGFITKRDMQRLQMELPLSPEQLETVFESLDRESNGFLTPLEFSTGLGELMEQNDSTEQSQDLTDKEREQVDWSENSAAITLTHLLNELGADKLFDSRQELCSLWCELQRERPELLCLLEGILLHALTRLQDSIRDRDSLEQALRRRETEHDQVVRSIYEEMENQLREEQEKRLAQDSVRQKQRGLQLEEELKMRDQELEITLSRQKELDTRMQQLIAEQVSMKEKNHQLRSLNMQLQEQAESSRDQLQAALGQLAQLQLSAAKEQVARQQNVIKVSRNMQKEKESLFRQLELLRDMNKNLRDEKDAQLTKKRNLNMAQSLLKRGSVVGQYFLQDKPLQRFRCITEQYYRKADGILVVYDVTQAASFKAVRGWMESVDEKACDGAVLMMLGNKVDLADVSENRKVMTRDGQKLAEQQHQALFYECSAKTGYNMEELMTHLAQMLVAQIDRQREDTLSLAQCTARSGCCA